MCKSLKTLSCLLVLFTALAFSFVTPALAGSDEATIRPVEKSLPCGAKALLWPRAGSGTVLVAVAVPAGSQDEAVEMAGLSHYLEHLLFDGFDGLDERGVTEAFENLSAYMNAFTREQTTVYFSLTPREEAAKAAELMVGMLTRSTIKPAVYEKEKKVILEELAKDHASADGLKEQALRALLWNGTPKAHPVGGYIESVKATPRDEVIRYWKARYRPASFRILLTGDMSVEGLEEVLAPFARLEAGETTPLHSDPLEWDGWGHWAAAPAPKSEAPKGPKMPGMPPGMMPGMGGGGAGEGGLLELVVAAPDLLTTAGTRLEVIARWLSSPSGPLVQALVPEFATSVSASRVPEDPRDYLNIRVEAVKGADPVALLSRLRTAMASAAQGPTEGELLRLLDAWTAERAITGQRLHYAAVFYGDAMASARGSLADALEPRPVSLAQVRDAAQHLLIGAAARTRAAWLGDGGPSEAVALAELAPPKPDPSTASGSADGPMGSVVTTLPNGLTLGILPELGSPVFGVHLLVADRSVREPEGNPGIADLIHRLLPAGTVLSGSQEFADRIERAGIEIKAADSPMIPFDNRYHVPSFSYLRIEGPSSSLETSLAMLAEMIRKPAWDERGWKQAVASHDKSIKADNRGSSMANRIFKKVLLGDEHPLARPVSGQPDGPTPTPEQVREAWGQYPGGYFAPERLILTISSPLPVDQTQEIVRTFFSSQSASKPQRGPYPEAKGSGQAAEIELGEAPQITVLWGRLAQVAEEDRAALLVAADALSDRMVAIIREREGLAYRLGAGAGSIPGGQWMISASVGTRPENKDRVTSLLAELVEGLKSEPLAPEDLQRLASRARRSRMLRSLSATSRAYRLGRILFEGRTGDLGVGEAAYSAVTAEQVQAASRKYFDTDEMILVITP